MTVRKLYHGIHNKRPCLCCIDHGNVRGPVSQETAELAHKTGEKCPLCVNEAAQVLLTAKHTLNDIGRMLRNGQICVEVAEAFFKEWCTGKMSYRWNEAAGHGEEEVINRYDTNNTWRRISWSSIGRD